jgi:thymidylate synthase (FAD)
MKQVEPEVYLVGSTEMYRTQEYLESIDAEDWQSDGPTTAEQMVEMYGRMCYRSFAPGLNPNVTKVREGNQEYLQHVIQVGHGSILEHVQTNWVLHNVSRVLTHELVRHRAGCAYSQESLRFVRLDSLSAWLPPVISDDPVALEMCREELERQEDFQRRLQEHLKVDEQKSFKRKKLLTSACRRFAPIGLATTLGFSCNIRSLRHIIEMRTDPSAEIEIRLVFDRVATIAKEQWPNFFADFERKDDGTWVSGSKKV